MSFLSSNNRPRRVVQETVSFVPAWLDENGFLVNIPGPDLLSNFPLKKGTNRVVGVYEHHYPEVALVPGQSGFQNVPPIHTDLLRFTISKQVIHQEMPNGEKAIIRFDHNVIQVFAVPANHLVQIWKPYLVPKKVDGQAQGVETKWLKSSVIGPKQLKLPDDAVPTMLGDLFTNLTDHMETTVRGMGYQKEMDQDIESAADAIFPWLYRLAQEDSDSRYSHEHSRKETAWLYAAPDVEMRRMWTCILQHCQSMRHKSREDRINRKYHELWLEQLRSMIEYVVTLRNVRFPAADGIWSDQSK